MFGNNKKEIEELQQQIQQLQKKLKESEESHQNSIKVLRQQLVAFAMSYPLSGDAILSGLPYSEIPKERVAEFIAAHPEVLVLDVRSDAGWNSGHIPNAKHIAAEQVLLRLSEFSSKKQPILTICANGNTGLTVAQQLAREGFQFVFNALGGMAGYTGPLESSQMDEMSEDDIEGEDRDLVRKVVEIMNRDIRPGLKKDGGDLKILAVKDGVVDVKMVGACLGCGALNHTVNDGIKKHLLKLLPELKDLRDLSKSAA